jgi:hypothetical protein
MDTLQRATQLLRPFMEEARRGTWLTLAFHGQHRALYDAIPVAGATTDFTVRCVRLLLDRGCLGPRHALSLLLEVVRVEAGEDHHDGFRTLIDELDHPCIASRMTPESSPSAKPAPPVRELVYISYRHEDRQWHRRLRRVLDADSRLRGRVWDDTRIPGGADWQREIDEHVPRARVMIMLASDDYFDPRVSGAFEPEIAPALAAHRSGEMAVLWIPVRPMSVATSPVWHITAATGARAVPLVQLTPQEQAAALLKVYTEVLRQLGIPAEPVPQAVRYAAQASGIQGAESPGASSRADIPGTYAMTSTSTILFLAASPEGEPKLALDKEAREIRSKIRASDHRDSLLFRTEWAVRPDDLLQYLNEYRPRAVHFSGHGTASEVVLNDEHGRAKPVSQQALRALFGLHAQTVRLVVLNACFSKAQAEAIVEVVDSAVGMTKAIGDDAAIVFAAAFYRKLGFGDSVKEAFEEGCVALMLQGISEEKTPELLIKSGVDASKVFLVGPNANPR